MSIDIGTLEELTDWTNQNYGPNDTRWNGRVLSQQSALIFRKSIESRIQALEESRSAFIRATSLSTFWSAQRTFGKQKTLQIEDKSKGRVPRSIAISIGGINGIRTSESTSNSHQAYLASLVPDQKVDWVYNKTNGFFRDMLEVFWMNYQGYSPNTAKALQEKWTAFHEGNKANPDAKYLQFCFSQGAIHVRNGLESAPREIRKRVIVIAIAPGAIVPKELCFRSFNYASKNDIVPKGELFWRGAFDSNECGLSRHSEEALRLYYEELIILDPHPNAKGIDHDFQSPTFKNKIEGHIRDYLKHKGQYPGKQL